MPLRKQVNYLKVSKKVVLVLVEGITDETTLGLILSKIIGRDYVVRFHVIGGDIAAKTGVNRKNCLNKLVDEVKKYIEKDFYKKSDISEIIQLVDMDGTYIPDDHVVFDQRKLEGKSHIYYTEEEILTDQVERIIQRNKQKSVVLDKYIETKRVYGGIPYRIFFFSCNLEHVLYNVQNLPDKNKYLFASEVQELYAEQPVDFINFMNSSEIESGEEYHSSWENVKKTENSLKRRSNLNLYLNQFK